MATRHHSVPSDLPVVGVFGHVSATRLYLATFIINTGSFLPLVHFMDGSYDVGVMEVVLQFFLLDKGHIELNWSHFQSNIPSPAKSPQAWISQGPYGRFCVEAHSATQGGRGCPPQGQHLGGPYLFNEGDISIQVLESCIENGVGVGLPGIVGPVAGEKSNKNNRSENTLELLKISDTAERNKSGAVPMIRSGLLVTKDFIDLGGYSTSEQGGNSTSEHGGNSTSEQGGNSTSEQGGNSTSEQEGNSTGEQGGNSTSEQRALGNSTSDQGGYSTNEQEDNSTSEQKGNSTSEQGGNSTGEQGGNSTSEHGDNSTNEYGRNSTSEQGEYSTSEQGGNSSREITQQVNREVTQQVSREITQQVSREETQQGSRERTQQVSRERTNK
ncbi:hypothetical protein MAR_027034 [Mya arenaria]|uniref:Uncharacterized protein n=1 Tax=Mya arenaria TaxID=6604 RepID=A0ABY7EUR4_MYAAR|nr:hypothetical protein MAR_027034 [Mya arenaria]